MLELLAMVSRLGGSVKFVPDTVRANSIVMEIVLRLNDKSWSYQCVFDVREMKINRDSQKLESICESAINQINQAMKG